MTPSSPGAEAHLCNPSYSRDGDQEDLQFEADLGKKKVSDTTSQQNKTRMVVHICPPSYVGGRGRRITI
jgi:hypothetical protein